MKYRTKSGQLNSDQAAIGNLSKGLYHAAQRNVIVLALLSLFDFLIGIGAYATKCFLRRKFGERTIGILTILLTIVLIWGFHRTSAIYLEEITSFIEKGNTITFIPRLLFGLVGLLFYFLITLGGGPEKLDADVIMTIAEGENIIGIWITVIIAVSVYHLFEVFQRRFQGKEMVNSLYQGDSFIFGWFKGRKVLGFEITNVTIWMIFEPLFVLFIATIFWKSYEAIAATLAISSLCLFIEGYRIYKENRQLHLEIMDGRLEADYIAKLQKKYDERLLNSEPKFTSKKAQLFSGSDNKITKTQNSQASRTRYKARIL